MIGPGGDGMCWCRYGGSCLLVDYQASRLAERMLPRQVKAGVYHMAPYRIIPAAWPWVSTDTSSPSALRLRRGSHGPVRRSVVSVLSILKKMVNNLQGARAAMQATEGDE